MPTTLDTQLTGGRHAAQMLRHAADLIESGEKTTIWHALWSAECELKRRDLVGADGAVMIIKPMGDLAAHLADQGFRAFRGADGAPIDPARNPVDYVELWELDRPVAEIVAGLRAAAETAETTVRQRPAEEGEEIAFRPGDVDRYVADQVDRQAGLYAVYRVASVRSDAVCLRDVYKPRQGRSGYSLDADAGTPWELEEHDNLLWLNNPYNPPLHDMRFVTEQQARQIAENGGRLPT